MLRRQACVLSCLLRFQFGGISQYFQHLQRRHETSTVDRSISSLRIFGRITVDRARFFRVFLGSSGSYLVPRFVEWLTYKISHCASVLWYPKALGL
ncbi:hypothetical protein F4806DRAFT_446606 [Annulohypoxylon nitens]|nr:hypothetical protein F4806DRAFT_446606 [Annulohypoxylon nitens]